MKCSGWGRIGRYVRDPHSSGKWFNKENVLSSTLL